MTSHTDDAKQEQTDRDSVLAHHRSQRNLLFFGLFCFLTILLPDSALIVSDRSIHMPGLNVPVSLYHFIPIASVILIALAIHVHALQSERLKCARTGSADPTLFHLPPGIERMLEGFISYVMVPLTLGAMTYSKALKDPLLGSIMLILTVLVTLWLIGLLHQRLLRSVKNSVTRVERWGYATPYVILACVILLPLAVAPSGEVNDEIERKIESTTDNGNARDKVGAVYALFLQISTPYEICVKNWLARPLNLAFADLSGASLPRAYLKDANLLHANLQGARLPGADLSDAHLVKANFKGAHLYRADLQDAELRWADMEGASLYRANLKDAKLKGADLEGANLSRANLVGAELEIADLRNTRLKKACLLDANLEKATLDGADLEGAYLLRAELETAKLRADLEKVKLDEAAQECLRDVQGTDLPEADRADATLPCCAYLLTAREGDLDSISRGSPVYTRERRVGYVLSTEYYRDDRARGRRFIIILQNKASYWSTFYITLAKHAKVPEDGIAFDEPVSSDELAEEYHPFPLYRNRVDGRARTSPYDIHFDRSVHGLEVGAPVKLSGIEVGDVHGIDLTPKEDGKPQVTIRIRVMERLGRGDDMESRDVVCGGLRAQLRRISPRDPQLFVELDPDFGTAEVVPGDCPRVASAPGIDPKDRTQSQGAEGPG